MNENSPDVNCPRNSATEQGSCCDRLPAGTSTTVNDSSMNASSAAMLQKRPPVNLCNNRSLCILEELNRIYEERLNDIDQQTNGDHELKYLTYKEWVEMLLKLMRDLIDVVQELEYEASCRIDLLEKKLQSEASATCNTTDLGKLRNDVSNLVELIRRALQEGSWNMEGLNFCTIKLHDIFGQKLEFSDSSSAQTCILDSPRKHNSSDDDTLTGTEEDEVFKACISELKECLKEKELQLAEKLKQNECLQTELRLYKTQAAQKNKAIANMRALAFEVADKHDQVIQLRDQVNSLEEELKKAHKKVQFKDNVIRELRREIKNATKQEDTASTACICMSIRQPGSDTENKSFKSVTFNDLDCTQRSEYNMNIAMDPEIAQLGNSVRDEEDRCIQTLKDELEGLLVYQACHCAAIEDQKHIMAAQHARLRDIIYKMLSDLSKNRNKLFFMRTRLLEIACGRDNSLHCNPKHQDSGYVSPEDLETECHILDKVSYKINEIKAENDSLREQIRISNTDMMSKNTSFDRCSQCGNTEKILQEVASALSNLCGHKVSGEVTSELIHNDAVQIHPISQAILTLENELNEKNKNLCDSQNLLMAKDCQLQRLQEELRRFEEELNNKNYQIIELQEAVDVHMSSIERLKLGNDHLEAELARVRRMTETVDCKVLLEAKQKLEVECQNQLTTINNLRQALENTKKSGSSNNNQSGHSPPVICRDLAHDVLSEQLRRMFKESMRSEATLVTLRDENLALKELLVDTECDFRNLERKYLSISKYSGSNELHCDFQHLNERSNQLHQEIELRGGVSCVRHIRCKMEKECEKRLKEQEAQYHKIIDDLTADLITISKQVQVTQSELSRDELEHFDASFQELELQNEKLQHKIKDLEEKIHGYQNALFKNQTETQQLISQNTITMNVLRDKDAKYRELTDQFQQLTRSVQALNDRCGCGAIRIIQATIAKAEILCKYLENQKDNPLSLFNEYTAAQISSTSLELNDRVKELQAKINVLEKNVHQRDKELCEANTRLFKYAQQNGELKTELYMAQDQIFYLQAEGERLRTMVDRMSHEITELRAGRKDRDNGLMMEMHRLRQTMDEHAKALNTANTTINMMERQRRDLQLQFEMTNKENSALKVEVLALKEGTATREGIEKGLRNQLVQTQSEVTLLKCDLERYLCLRKDIEKLTTNCTRLKTANYDLVRKYNDLVEDYNNLEDEYRKLVEIKDQLFTEVENSRIWQKEQKEQDQIIAKKFKKLEEHIDSLLEDRKKLIMKIGELHRDSILISGELDQVKDLCSGAFSKMDDRVRLSLDFGESNDDVLIKRVQRIARKLSQTRSIWQNELQRSTD